MIFKNQEIKIVNYVNLKVQMFGFEHLPVTNWVINLKFCFNFMTSLIIRKW